MRKIYSCENNLKEVDIKQINSSHQTNKSALLYQHFSEFVLYVYAYILCTIVV